MNDWNFGGWVSAPQERAKGIRYRGHEYEVHNIYASKQNDET
jgi:hypothetical protein